MKDHAITTSLFSANMPKHNENAHSALEQKTTKGTASYKTHTIANATSSPAGKHFVSRVRAFFHKPSKLVNVVRAFSLRSFIGKIRQVFTTPSVAVKTNYVVKKEVNNYAPLSASCNHNDAPSHHYFNEPQQSIQSPNHRAIETQALTTDHHNFDTYILRDRFS